MHKQCLCFTWGEKISSGVPCIPGAPPLTSNLLPYPSSSLSHPSALISKSSAAEKTFHACPFPASEDLLPAVQSPVLQRPKQRRFHHFPWETLSHLHRPHHQEILHNSQPKFYGFIQATSPCYLDPSSTPEGQIFVILPQVTI